MNEDMDLGAMLSEAVGGQDPQADVSMVAPTEQEPSATDDNTAPEPTAQEPLQEPQFDPSRLTEQMNVQAESIARIAEQMNEVTNNIQKPEAPIPTEEDLLRSQMKKDLGLDQMEAKFKAQQEMLDKQQQMIARQEQMDIVRSRESEFKSMEAEYGNIDKVAIQNKIMEIGKANPALADAMNSPEGVRMLLSQGVGAVIKTPDPITPSASASEADSSASVQKLSDGNLSDSDFGELLFNSM